MALDDTDPPVETLILDDVCTYMMQLYTINGDVLMSKIAYANRPHTHTGEDARVWVMVTLLRPIRQSIEDTQVFHVLKIHLDNITFFPVHHCIRVSRHFQSQYPERLYTDSGMRAVWFTRCSPVIRPTLSGPSLAHRAV